MTAGIAEGGVSPAIPRSFTAGRRFFFGRPPMMGAGVLEHSRHELDGIFAVIEAWLLAAGAKPVPGRKAHQGREAPRARDKEFWRQHMTDKRLSRRLSSAGGIGGLALAASAGASGKAGLVSVAVL